MKTVEEARAAMLSGVRALPAETARLDDALGRTLAEAIRARGAQPPFDASAMDGWAVRRADTPGVLLIAGESAAGTGYAKALGAGEAVRTFTGAPVPFGADCIVLQEDARVDEGRVIAPAASAQHIRKRGSDFAEGAVLLEAGTRLDGVALALAAAAGFDPVTVARRPRVVVLATGDELAAPGATLKPDQIFESVSFGVAALARSWGAEATRLAIAGDRVEAIVEAAASAAKAADIVVTIGGASVGAHDLVKPAAKAMGAALTVENVKMRPGKPVWFATSPAACFLGLPGNPASALVCAHLFLRPLLNTMLGGEGIVRFTRARLGGGLRANGAREHYVRARLETDEAGAQRATPFESQDSGRLTVFQSANALIRLPPNAPALEAGALIDVLTLERSA
jgi:molybdopterin molybdotransferase